MASVSQHIADPADRGRTFRMQGLERIPLHLIGFWPPNRGGVGILGHHVHEVANDVMINGTKVERYNHVELVLIPPDLKASILKANEEKCASDPLLPAFSKDMIYVTVTNTHFTHAAKLAKQGDTTFYNQSGKEKNPRKAECW